eukprot:1190778-Prorocentrum_minimum.AAC.1
MDALRRSKIPLMDSLDKFPFRHEPEVSKLFWDVRKGLIPIVGGAREAGTSMLIEDVACPVENLGPMTRDLIEMFKKFEYHDASCFGHALEGNLHLVFSQVCARAEGVRRGGRRGFGRGSEGRWRGFRGRYLIWQCVSSRDTSLKRYANNTRARAPSLSRSANNTRVRQHAGTEQLRLYASPHVRVPEVGLTGAPHGGVGPTGGCWSYRGSAWRRWSNMGVLVLQGFRTEAEVERYSLMMQELCELVADKYGGSLKAEHGTGRNVAPFVEMEWGKKATDLMWELKELFDPDYVLNPGTGTNRRREILNWSQVPGSAQQPRTY